MNRNKMEVEEKPISAGAKLEVTVESAQNGVLLVRYESQGKLFRGVLLDSIRRFWSNDVNSDESPVACSAEETKLEISALYQRHTYFKSLHASDTRKLPSPKKDIAMLLWQKGHKSLARPCEIRNSCQKVLKREDSNPTGMNANPNKSLLSHFTPAITISYSTPEGEDAVVKIQPRPSHHEDQEKLLAQLIEGDGIDNQAYRRLRRALKMARRKHKQDVTSTGSSAEATPRKPILRTTMKVASQRRVSRSNLLRSKKERQKKPRRVLSKRTENEQDRTLEEEGCASGAEEVNEVVMDDGTTFQCGCIAWAKITGCPWWPCRVRTFMKSTNPEGIVAYTANVSWFATKTFSVVDCTGMRPFLEDFHLRYTRKQRKSGYRSAVRSALAVAKLMTKNSDFLSLKI